MAGLLLIQLKHLDRPVASGIDIEAYDRNKVNIQQVTSNPCNMIDRQLKLFAEIGAGEGLLRMIAKEALGHLFFCQS